MDIYIYIYYNYIHKHICILNSLNMFMCAEYKNMYVPIYINTLQQCNI